MVRRWNRRITCVVVEHPGEVATSGRCFSPRVQRAHQSGFGHCGITCSARPRLPRLEVWSRRGVVDRDAVVPPQCGAFSAGAAARRRILRPGAALTPGRSGTRCASACCRFPRLADWKVSVLPVRRPSTPCAVAVAIRFPAAPIHAAVYRGIESHVTGVASSLCMA